MPMQLFFKRAKAFVNTDEGTKKFLAQHGPYAQSVPFWVAETPTFIQGIKDGSIVNLTPPEQMPGYKYPKHAEPQPEEEAVKPEPEEEQEQTAADTPQAPFGGQPMTPVPPAPKVGGITGNAKKAK